MAEKSNWWDYYEENEPGVLKISPSQFHKFITQPWNWYRSQILKEDPFTGSTSTHLGTIVHRCCECAAEGIPISRHDIEEFLATITDPDVDKDVIREAYPAMASTIVNDYVLPNKERYLATEKYIGTRLTPFVKLEGSIDAILGDTYYLNEDNLRISKLDYDEGLAAGKAYTKSTENVKIVDYKTYNAKRKPESIPYHYRYQLLCYATILRAHNYNVTEIELVYVNRHIDGGISAKTGNALKSYPPEVTVFTERVTDESLAFMSSQLELCLDTLAASEEYPDLRNVIWHDPRL